MEIGSKTNMMKYPLAHKERMEEWTEIWEKIPPYMSHKASKTWEKEY